MPFFLKDKIFMLRKLKNSDTQDAV